MKKKILFYLSFMFIVCMLCLPFAVSPTEASAEFFDIANYTIIPANSANEYVAAELYSNAKEGSLFSPQNPVHAQSKVLSVSSITSKSGQFQALSDFDNKVYYMPDKGEKVGVEYLSPTEIKITAKKAGSVILFVAIGTSPSLFDVFSIKFEVICDLSSIEIDALDFYQSTPCVINVGQQKAISVEDLIGKEANLRDHTDLTFTAVKANDDAKQCVEIDYRTFNNNKMFTIVGTKVSSGNPSLEVSLEDKKGNKLVFFMDVDITARGGEAPLITVDGTNITIFASETKTSQGSNEYKPSHFALCPDGNAVVFNAEVGEHHALFGNANLFEITDEGGEKEQYIKNEFCEIRILKINPGDPTKNVLQVTPIKNGIVSLTIYVSNAKNPTIKTKVLITVTIKQIYEIDTIYIDSLKKATLSIHDTEVFGKLEADGYSLTKIEGATATSDYLVAKVESGSLVLNPKAVGTTDIVLVFSDGANQLSIPVTVEIHKFDLFKDFSQLTLIGILAGLILLILIIILLIIRGVKRRKKRVVEKVESTVVIGKRDASGQVVNTALLKAQNQKPTFATNINTMATPMPFMPQMLPHQPYAQTNIALNAGFAPQPQAQPTQVFLNQPPMQQQPQNIFMALPQADHQHTQYQTQLLPQMQPQNEFQNQYALGSAPHDAPQINFSDSDRQDHAAAPQTIVMAAPQNQQAQQSEEASRSEHENANDQPNVFVQNVYVYSSLDPSDDEILETVFKERYQNTMKYRAYKKDKELQVQILEEERARLQREKERLAESEDASASTESVAVRDENIQVDTRAESDKTTAQGTTEGVTTQLISAKWIAEADLSELIDKKIDFEEEILKTNAAIKEIDAEKERMEVAASDAMKKYKKLEGEITELKIELNDIKNPDDATPIYEKLNAKEGEYNELKEDMPTFVEKLKERRRELDKLDENNKTYKVNLELAKLDIDDRIKVLKEQLSEEEKQQIAIEVAEAAVSQVQPKEGSADDDQKDEVTMLIESILLASAARGETELKREDVKLRKEFAEEELKEVSEKMAKSNNDAERQMLKSDISKLKSDIDEYKKSLAEFDALMAKQAVVVAEKEGKLAAQEKSAVAEEKLNKLAAEKAKLEAELREEKQRIIADRQTAEDKKQKTEEMDALTEFMLKTMSDRNRTELKTDNIRFRKELTDQKIKDLEQRLENSKDPREQANLKNEIQEKKEDILDYGKKLREYENYIAEYDDRMKELEQSLAAITNKYGMEKQLQEFNMARVQQEFDHKVDKERIRSERTIETERIEAERKLERERQEAERMLQRERQQGEARLSSMADERLLAAERAFEQARQENERKLKELEEKSKQGSLEERLMFKRQQLNFVAEDIPRMKDSEQGANILQKVEKIEKDLAQDERNSDIIFEIGRVKDSVNHSIQLCKLREELSKRDTASVVKQAPAPQTAPPMAQQAPQQQTRTVVRKVTNNVRKVASSKSRQPQVIRVQGSRPRPEGRSDMPARRPAGSSSTRMGARPERPVSRSARPATSTGTRSAARPTRPAGARPQQARPSRPAPRR